MLALGPALFLTDAWSAEPARERTSANDGGFSLLPKSLQRNPWMDFNIVTEFTREGRAVPLPTGEKPAYYILQPGAMVALGAASGGEKPPPIEELRRTMQRALAGNHYREATREQRATLVIVFNFGSSVSDIQIPDEVRDEPGAAPQTAEELLPFLIRGQDNELNRVLERASLIGGAVFGKQFRDAIAAEIEAAKTGADPAFRNPAPSSAFQRFKNQSPLNAHLLEVAFHSCYYVIASAYEAAALAEGRRKLLWRTKITVDSDGVSMSDAMLPLISSATPHLGRPMSEAAIVRKPLAREGNVEIGEAKTVEALEESASTQKK